jgi:hypothetical protein
MDTANSVLDTVEIGIEGECPICTKNPPFNATTIAAIKEGEAILKGEIPTRWYNSLEEARKDLGM